MILNKMETKIIMLEKVLFRTRDMVYIFNNFFINFNPLSLIEILQNEHNKLIVLKLYLFLADYLL
jgi:hypothetical protein